MGNGEPNHLNEPTVNVVVLFQGIYMKDLTFIAEGNPDFFKGGLINLTKRRQVNSLAH